MRYPTQERLQKTLMFEPQLRVRLAEATRDEAVSALAMLIAAVMGDGELAVLAAVIVLLEPGDGGVVEHLQGERVDAFEHRHQTRFDRAPERLDLAVLMRTVSERRDPRCCFADYFVSDCPICFDGSVRGFLTLFRSCWTVRLVTARRWHEGRLRPQYG